MLHYFKISISILGFTTAIASSACFLPAHAFVVSFSNLDDLDDTSSGLAFPPNSIDQGNFESDNDLFFF